MNVNSKGYIERITGKRTTREWWLITSSKAIVPAVIRFPEQYIGKKIKIKVEVIQDGK